MLGCNQHISHDPLDHINFPMSTWLTQITEIASKWSKLGSEIVPSWSPMQLNIQYWQPEFHSWSPAGDLSVKLVVIVDFLLRRKWLGIETPKLFANALINVKLVGGRGGSRAWGGDFYCLCWPWGRAFEKILFSWGRGYLNLSSPSWDRRGDGFDCRLGRKRLSLNIICSYYVSPLPRFTHAMYGLKRSGNHGSQQEQAKGEWTLLYWSIEPFKTLWYQSKWK